MLCADVFSDEIEAERNGTSSSTTFTDAFVNILPSQTPPICPSKDVLLNKMHGLAVVVVPCSQYSGYPYPIDSDCSPTLEGELTYFRMISTMVSSNFDPDLYSQDQSLQYYSNDIYTQFNKTQAGFFPFIDVSISASKSMNTFSGNFFLPFADEESVSTTSLTYTD